MHAYRSHTCADLRAADAGSDVRLSGWVHRVRDHGGVLFLDLRDHYGITQVIADGDSPAFAGIERLKAETVVRIDGRVKARDASLVNPKLPTGEIEVYALGVTVLGPADDLPLPVFGDVDYPEETRLTYRFLDLRREGLHANMMLRSNVVRSIRNRMWAQGFNEFQTPIITASSPEGARDFLVPSRLHPGKFYALPQAPQQFKQLLMVAGFDRYFQIAPCFRDEDPRADRSPDGFLPAGPGDELCHAGGCVRCGPAGDAGDFRGVCAGQDGACRLAADFLPGFAAVVRVGQARPAQPDQDAGGQRAFPGIAGSRSLRSCWSRRGTRSARSPRRAAGRASSRTG